MNRGDGRRKHGLAWIAPLLAAATFVVLLVAFYASLADYRASIERDACRELAARAELAAMTLAEPLRTQDFAAVRSFGDSCRRMGYYLCITSAAGGRLFANYQGVGPTKVSIRAFARAGEYDVMLFRARGEVFAPFRRAHKLFLLAALAGAVGVFVFFFAFYRQRVRLRELARAERFRREFVADVSHEIKTPLTGILGAVEMLRDDPPDAAVRARLLDMAAKESDRLNALVQQILDLARLEREGERLDLVGTDLADLARETVERMRPRAEAAGVKLVLGPCAANCVAKVDARLVSEALSNLVGNALRHSGSPDVEVAVSVAGGKARFSVEDHGVGIPAEHAERVFERFHRVDPARAAESGGAGLGLAIVRRIARLHGGDAALSPVSPHGCRFEISLPVG